MKKIDVGMLVKVLVVNDHIPQGTLVKVLSRKMFDGEEVLQVQEIDETKPITERSTTIFWDDELEAGV